MGNNWNIMRDESESIESLLLDLHLGRLDPASVRKVEEATALSPEWASRRRALGGVLELLDAYETPEPPDGLAESVMARVREQAGVLPIKEAASAVPAGAAQDLSASPVLSLRELIAIAACITLFVGVFVPGYFKAQNAAQRNLCQRHLSQIWQGMAAYAKENDGYMTWAGYVPHGSWLATRTPNVRRYSPSRPLFMLLRQGFIPDHDPRVFICPSMPHSRPMIAEDYREFNDFAEPANVSYSVQLMNRPKGWLMEKTNARMVLIADRNPLFDERACGHRISPYDDGGNSFTHGDGAGQNAVFVDGSGGWFTEPTIGVAKDNIYRVGEMVHYQGTEEPVSDEDSFLP